MDYLELPYPPRMTAQDRAQEVAYILAVAIARIGGGVGPESEVGLGFCSDQRVHTNPYQQKDLS